MMQLCLQLLVSILYRLLCQIIIARAELYRYHNSQSDIASSSNYHIYNLSMKTYISSFPNARKFMNHSSTHVV